MSTARPSNLPPPGGAPRASDVRRRTVAPTTLQNLIAAAATKTHSELPSEEYLDKMEEELNRKVDVETDVLVEGMAEMVKLSQVRSCSLPSPLLHAFSGRPCVVVSSPARGGRRSSELDNFSLSRAHS